MYSELFIICTNQAWISDFLLKQNYSCVHPVDPDAYYMRAIRAVRTENSYVTKISSTVSYKKIAHYFIAPLDLIVEDIDSKEIEYS